MLLLLVFSQLELAYLSNANVLKFSAQKIMSGSPVLVDFRGGESLPEIRDKIAVARAHQGRNGCEFV